LLKFISKITGTFAKFADVTGLTRLKVFYQILVVILVMILFLGLQTFTNVGIINTMHHTAQNIFVKNSSRLNEISRFKQNITKLQAGYLEAIINNTTTSYLDSYSQGLIAFEWMDKENKQNISHKLALIKKALNNPPNKGDYENLRNTIFDLTIILDRASSALSSETTNGITNNNLFLNQSKINGIIIMVISALFATLIGLLIANSISASLKQIESAAKSLAAGDLTRHIVSDGSPEISKTIHEFNRAITNLRELVTHINSQSDVLYQASRELKTASSESGKSSSDVARATEELVKGSTRQAEQIAETVNNVHLLSDLVQQISQNTLTITSAFQQGAQAAQTSVKASSDVANGIQELYVFTQKMNVVINDLSRSTDQITEITSSIDGIADQTSLLSLNAAIEAARAGEHGKGFAVVAQETGKLAEESKKAAALIVGLVHNIKARTDEAVNTIQGGLKIAENSKTMITQTSTNFQLIFQSLHDNLGQIETVVDSTRKMDKNNQTVLETINEIAAISEETIANTEEVSSNAEEQSASSQQVAALAESLNQIADDLHHTVIVFELNAKA
jgi:methyl-accepting chemotaxis protein